MWIHCVLGFVLPVDHLSHPQPLRKWKSFLSPCLALVFSLIYLLWVFLCLKTILAPFPGTPACFAHASPRRNSIATSYPLCSGVRNGGAWATQPTTTFSIPHWRSSVTSFQSKKKNNFNSGNLVPQDQQFWIFKLNCQFWFYLLSVYRAVIIPDKYPVSFVVDFWRNGMIEYDVPFPLKQFLLNFNASWFFCHLCREQYFP